jgi:predicted esterase
MDSPETLQPLYADLTKHGWRVALAGSGQYGGPEALVWDSATQADEEARTWSGELGGQPVWAGYSAGAGVALRNVLTTAVPASGVLAVAPSVPSNPSWWSEHLTHVPVALILGRTDPHTPNALALAERLRTLGIPLREWTHEGGHTHPDNWKRLRDEALAWLSSGG